MKKITVLGVGLLCILMLVVGFAPSYIDFTGLPNTAEVEDIALPPVAAAELPVLPQAPLAEEPTAVGGNNCDICACKYGADCDCDCGYNK